MNEKEWWEPLVENGQNEWLCDHLGDAQEKLDELWKQHQNLKTRFDQLLKISEAMYFQLLVITGEVEDTTWRKPDPIDAKSEIESYEAFKKEMEK